MAKASRTGGCVECVMQIDCRVKKSEQEQGPGGP